MQAIDGESATPETRPRDSWKGWGGLLIAVAALLVYLSNFTTLGSGDTIPAALIPITVLTEGTTQLDSFAPFYTGTTGHTPYFLHRTRSGTVSAYPLATGLLAIPVYAIPVAIFRAGHERSVAEWVRFSGTWQKGAAALFSALAVLVFFKVCLALEAEHSTACWLTAALAFGSQLWSTASQGLWMHGPGTLFLLLTVQLALRHARAPNLVTAMSAGLVSGIAVAIRLNNALFIAPLAAWLLWRERRHWPAGLAAWLAIVIPLLLYNQRTFGSLTGGYAHDFGNPIWPGLSGSLFSPARGLLIYFPLAGFGVAGLIASVFHRPIEKPIHLAFGVAIVASIGVTAKWGMWYGGHCYGPRLLGETEPFLLLAALPALGGWTPRWWSGLFIAALVWSMFLQAVGAYLYQRSDWNTVPRNVDAQRERLWDWRDNPVSRAIVRAAARD